MSGGTWCHRSSLLLMLSLITWLTWCPPDFSSEKSLFFLCYWLLSWGWDFKTLLVYCFSSKFCPDFIIHQWSLPAQWFLWCLPNDNFVFYSVDYNSVLLFSYFVAQIVLALASGSSSRLAPVFSPALESTSSWISPGSFFFFFFKWF